MSDDYKLVELDEEIKKRYPHHAVLDGIVNIDKFNVQTKKILWVLKESDILDENVYKNGFFQLNDSLNEGVTNHGNWQRTWGLVMEISDAILHNAQDWEEEVPLIERLLKEEIIKNIAVINVKKTGGGSNSDQNIINDFYNNDKCIIKAQITAIEPDIIINASRVKALFNDLKIGDSQKVRQFEVAKFNGGIIIDAYHPNQRSLSHKQYFELIRDCIKTVS
jgi:hypothetical protein